MEKKTHGAKTAAKEKALTAKKTVNEKKPIEKVRFEKKMEAVKKTEAGKKGEPQKTVGHPKMIEAKKPVETGKAEPEKKEIAVTEKKALPRKEKKERVSHTATPERKKRAKIQALIVQKKRTRFRGRFGKPNVRRKSIEKWQKWRKPRGIDIRRGEHKGKRPNSGFGSPRETRGLHPSGFEEVRIASLNEIRGLKSGIAIRIQAGIGQKKRKQMILDAKQKGIHVLN